jgi:hypothetical protein
MDISPDLNGSKNTSGSKPIACWSIGKKNKAAVNPPYGRRGVKQTSKEIRGF